MLRPAVILFSCVEALLLSLPLSVLSANAEEKPVIRLLEEGRRLCQAFMDTEHFETRLKFIRQMAVYDAKSALEMASDAYTFAAAAADTAQKRNLLELLAINVTEFDTMHSTMALEQLDRMPSDTGGIQAQLKRGAIEWVLSHRRGG